MSERELLGLMAAIVRAGDIANGEVTSSLWGSAEEAFALLRQIDARLYPAEEPPKSPQSA